MRERELRLALVCYGGISLAVYMHGITKEVWRVACASRAFHQHEPRPDGIQGVYHDLLDEIAREAQMMVRVLPDIIAGASAGGINGIFLAHALSTGQSLDPLTEMWLKSADVEALIDADAAPASRFSKVWALPIAWMAAGRSTDDLDDLDPATRDEVRAKLSHFVRSRWFEPPFGGERFSGLLLDAFEAMASGPVGPRLLPDGQPLDLFVTVTDFTGHPERLKLNSPPEVLETEHRLVFAFSDHGDPARSLGDAPELAFAARATSSFPGAFPPFDVGELDRVLEKRARRWPGRDAFLARVLPRQAAAKSAHKVVMIDGSVLANAPFRPAIDALADRPARRPVDRRFVYIDPSPGHKFRLTGEAHGVPGFFQTILGAVSELPRHQPIRDNLEAIAARSARIERMRGIVSAIRPEVDAEVESLFGYTLFLDRPTPARLSAWRRRANAQAAAKAGYGYAAYGHLKLISVIEAMTQTAYAIGGEPGPQRWRRIRRLIGETLKARGLDERAPGVADDETVIEFLRNHDLPFRLRRLRLLGRRIEQMESEAGEAAMQPMRDAVYESLSAYLSARAPDRHGALRRQIRELREDAAPVIDAIAAAIDLKRVDEETDARLADALTAMPKDLRRPLLLTYLGFPYFDVATLPLLQGEGLDEFDPIKVDRIAPDDARSIREGGAEATLKGIQFNSFGAFFSRSYRENDYLWGRLHGAERMIDIIVSTLPDTIRMKPGRVAAIKRQAFCAILDEEEPRLTAIAPLIASLRREIG